ncbi:MAG: cobalamin-dependent protein [Armatimonadetes bacterium]|nr:cobalamin-dependent protein [Armatimonadota bacterium]
MDLLIGSLSSAEVQEFRPAAAGISCSFTIDTYKTIEIARSLKQLCKEIFVFLGGHHASLNYSDFFDPAIDAVVVNEGETTTPELINALEGGEDLTKIPGLILNLPEGQFFTGERQSLSSLDDVPFPDRAVDNINAKSLLEVLKSPLCAAYQKRQPFNSNHLRPCPIIDNPQTLRDIVRESGTRPTHEGAETVLEGTVANYLDNLSLAWGKVADEIWKS